MKTFKHRYVVTNTILYTSKLKSEVLIRRRTDRVSRKLNEIKLKSPFYFKSNLLNYFMFQYCTQYPTTHCISVDFSTSLLKRFYIEFRPHSKVG